MRHDQPDVADRAARGDRCSNKQARDRKDDHSNAADLDAEIQRVALADHHQVQGPCLRREDKRSEYNGPQR
jgi:hypothetical protein